MALPWPFRQPRAEAAVARPRRCCCGWSCRAKQTVERGLRVPLELAAVAGRPRAGRRRAGAPSTCACAARPARSAASAPATSSRCSICTRARPGRRLFHADARAGARAVRRRGRAGRCRRRSTLAFETSASREVPVVPAIEGEPAPGFVVGTMTAEPATVEVVGPESAVKRATEASTEPVSVAGARDARSRRRVTVGVLDPALRLEEPRDRRRSRSRSCPAPRRADAARSAGAPAESRRRPAGARPCRRRSTSTLRGSREALGRVAADDVDGVRRSRRARRRRVHACRCTPTRRATRAWRASTRRQFRCGSPVANTDPRLFGTDGVRGAAGTLSARSADRARASARRWCGRCRTARASPQFLVGRDTRESGGWIEAELAHGACGEGAAVTSAGVVPTPAVAYLTRTEDLRRRRRDLGVAQSVRGQRHQGVLGPRREVHRGGRARGRGDRRRHARGACRRRRPAPCRAPISSTRTSITCARCFPTRPRSAASRSSSTAPTARRRPVAPRLFSEPRLRRRSSSATEPDGRNINLRLRLDASGAAGADRGRERGCRLGVAFDGDGDRAIFVDHRGRVVDGDAVLLMCGAPAAARGPAAAATRSSRP